MAMSGHVVVVTLGFETLGAPRAQWMLLTTSCWLRSLGLRAIQKDVLYEEADWPALSQLSPCKLDSFLLRNTAISFDFVLPSIPAWNACSEWDFQQQSLTGFIFIKKKKGFFHWGVVDLQCCVSFKCTAKIGAGRIWCPAFRLYYKATVIKTA